MSGYYELKKSKNGKYHFSLHAGNHQPLLASELYEEKRSALAGISSVQKNGIKDARFERKTSSRGEPYFNLLAQNGQIIGTSEMYSSEPARENGIESVITNSPSPVIREES
ncbi:MAG: YegP family protein [Luteolibacter sp.]